MNHDCAMILHCGSNVSKEVVSGTLPPVDGKAVVVFVVVASTVVCVVTSGSVVVVAVVVVDGW